MDPSLPTSELIIAKVNDGSKLGQPDIIQQVAKLDKSAVSPGKTIAVVTAHTIQTSRGIQQPGEFSRSQNGCDSLEKAQQWRASSAYKTDSAELRTNFHKRIQADPGSLPGYQPPDWALPR
ncbi:hypothetical protein MMC26_007352 [Xylographa opegraphella]|nr:hypothetical protein [Xylographa opegraphella]